MLNNVHELIKHAFVLSEIVVENSYFRFLNIFVMVVGARSLFYICK